MSEEFSLQKFLSDRDDEYIAQIRERRPRKPTKDNPLNFMEQAQDGLIGIHTMNTRETMPKAREFSPAYERALQYGSTAARYAAPALGVTAAGIGLLDLAAKFGGGADQPEQGQLGLNNGELSALGLLAASPVLAAGVGAGMGLFEGDDINLQGRPGSAAIADDVAASNQIAQQNAATGEQEQRIKRAAQRRAEDKAKQQRRRRR